MDDAETFSAAMHNFVFRNVKSHPISCCFSIMIKGVLPSPGTPGHHGEYYDGMATLKSRQNSLWIACHVNQNK